MIRKRSWRHLLFLVSALWVLMLLAAGCGRSGSEGETGGNPNEPGKGIGEPAKFRVLFDFNVDPQGMSLEDNEYTRFLLEKTGVKIELESPGSAGYMDKLNVLMASGNYPDAFMITDRDKLLQFAADGLLTDLAPYLDKYPNLKNKMPKDAWLPVTQQGKIWAVPFNRHDGFHQVVYINKKWLDNLNLPVPKTIDDFYNVLKAFTERDPDGNGKNDTFGLLGNNDLSYGGRIFQAAFDAETYKVVNNQLIPPEISNEYREYLTFMNRLIQEKILDPEWPTITSTVFREKVNTGKYGMFNGFWHFKTGREFAPGVMDNYIAIEPPLKKDGTPSYFTYATTNRHYIAIPKTTKNVEQLLRFFDWVVSDEGTRFVYLGIEGVHYTMNNGKPQLTSNAKHPIHWAFSLVKQGNLDDKVKEYLKFEYSDEVLGYLELANRIGRLDKIAASLPYFQELSAYNLKQISDEYRAKTVLGNEKIETSWENYVNKYKASGGEKMIQLYTEWYNKEGRNLK